MVPADMDPLLALVATVTSWTLLVDKRLMVKTTLERNRAQDKQLNDKGSKRTEREECGTGGEVERYRVERQQQSLVGVEAPAWATHVMSLNRVCRMLITSICHRKLTVNEM